MPFDWGGTIRPTPRPISASDPWFIQIGMNLAPRFVWNWQDGRQSRCAELTAETFYKAMDANLLLVELLDTPECAELREVRDYNRLLTEVPSTGLRALWVADPESSMSLRDAQALPVPADERQHSFETICNEFAARQRTWLANRLIIDQPAGVRCASDPEPIFDMLIWHFQATQSLSTFRPVDTASSRPAMVVAEPGVQWQVLLRKRLMPAPQHFGGGIYR